MLWYVVMVTDSGETEYHYRHGYCFRRDNIPLLLLLLFQERQHTTVAIVTVSGDNIPLLVWILFRGGHMLLSLLFQFDGRQHNTHCGYFFILDNSTLLLWLQFLSRQCINVAMINDSMQTRYLYCHGNCCRGNNIPLLLWLLHGDVETYCWQSELHIQCTSECRKYIWLF